MPRDGSQYDPDTAPDETERPAREFVGRLTGSTYIEDVEHAEELGEPMTTAYTRYCKKAERTLHEKDGKVKRNPCWYLTAEGISVVRSDGQPFVQSDIFPLETKDGRRMGKNMANGILHDAYLGLGVTASFARVGEPDSAVGRIFQFAEHKVTLGGFDKTIRLYPTELYPEGYEYDGAVRTITVDQDGNSDAPAEPVSVLSEAEAISLLQATLQDQPAENTFELVMANTELKTAGKVLGVALLEAATDDTLANVLKENAILTVDEQGIYRIPVAAAAAAA